MRTPEELWVRWHAIRMGAHSLTGKMREDKDTLRILVREEVERAVAEEREAIAEFVEGFVVGAIPGVWSTKVADRIRARSSPAKSGEEEKRG